MKIVEKNGLRVLTPNVGYRIINKERTEVYDGVVYLGKLDSIDNYISVTNAEAEELKKELDEYANQNHE